MRNVRIILNKKDRLKFVSHLDMNRFMSRILRLSGIPIWYTEGFNPHPYLTFALPLSLGFESDYEILDIRVIDDEFTNSQVKSALNNVLPEYMQVLEVFDAVLKPGKIAFAEFCVLINNVSAKDSVLNFVSKNEILVEKTGKKGKVSLIDLKPHIKKFEITNNEDKLVVNLILPAGGSCNINPSLIFDNIEGLGYYTITRKMVYDEQMHPFKWFIEMRAFLCYNVLN